MKNMLVQSAIILAGAFAAQSQGTMQIDQQNYEPGTPGFGTGGTIQQTAAPFGQSITPALGSVEFIQFLFVDGSPSNGLGATLYVNIRSGSMTGSIIGTSAALTMPDNYRGPGTFIFSSGVTVTPGTRYFFEPLVQSGDAWNILATSETMYPFGDAYVGGQPVAFKDLWFREGIFVPEPSIVALIGLGLLGYVVRRTKR
jgi:hypothetical protein